MKREPGATKRLIISSRKLPVWRGQHNIVGNPITQLLCFVRIAEESAARTLMRPMCFRDLR